MSGTAQRLHEQPAWLTAIFDRIVCGVDGTEGSLVAVRQVARLLPARRVIELVAVAEDGPSAWPSTFADEDRTRRYAEAQRAIADAHRLHPRAYTRVCFGLPGPTLAEFARETGATLVAVGAPTSGRLGGVILGSAGTHLLRHAASSVLVARSCIPEDAFPRSIVVGHDGSPNAVGAALVARELAHRFGASLRLVAATGGAPVGSARLAHEDDLEWSSLKPVDALTLASKEADLLVLGSRGLRGLRSLGSVSERLGHLAHCSVLVVREPPGAGGADGDAVPDLEC